MKFPKFHYHMHINIGASRNSTIDPASTQYLLPKTDNTAEIIAIIATPPVTAWFTAQDGAEKESGRMQKPTIINANATFPQLCRIFFRLIIAPPYSNPTLNACASGAARGR